MLIVTFLINVAS